MTLEGVVEDRKHGSCYKKEEQKKGGKKEREEGVLTTSLQHCLSSNCHAVVLAVSQLLLLLPVHVPSNTKQA